jgi:exopolysaccharide biosynthesis polyprenyl glycosylphosphotransferase
MNNQRVIIVGGGPLSKSVIMELQSSRCKRYSLVGVVRDHIPGKEDLGFSTVLGSLEDLSNVIDEHNPGKLVITFEEQRGKIPLNTLMNALLSKGIDVIPAQDFMENITGKLAIECITPSKLLFSDEFKPPLISQLLARIVSFLSAAIGLIVLSPALALFAIMIRIDSQGPAFFVQRRVGRNGKAFSLYKFRSMCGTSENRSEWVCDNSDRITRLGHWIRKHRIDELPQLYNVLRGDMCLVGPRPHPESNLTMFSLVARNMNSYGEQVPYYSIRLRVRPGITGWAQVKYKYANGLDEEIEKLRYDLYYVKNYSFFMDLKIIAKTAILVLFGEEVRESTASAIPRESKQ